MEGLSPIAFLDRCEAIDMEEMAEVKRFAAPVHERVAQPIEAQLDDMSELTQALRDPDPQEWLGKLIWN